MKQTILTLAVTCSAVVLLTQAPASADNTDTTTIVKSGDGDTLRAVFYEHSNFTGDKLKYYGGSACSSTTTDADYSMSVVPDGWNDKVSAIKDYSGCDVKIYVGGGFKGSATGFVNYGAGRSVPGGFNDTMSSFKVS